MNAALLAQLKEIGGRKLALEDIRRAHARSHPELQGDPRRDAVLLESLAALADGGALRLPAPGSKTGWPAYGPRLPAWVTLSETPAASEATDWARVSWVPALHFWPELRPAQLTDLLRVNEFLASRLGGLTPCPIKERSLQIFGDEKRLDALAQGDTLFGGRLTLAALGAFVVPLPLPYRAANAPGQPLLVVENHNSFWSLGEWNLRVRRYAAVAYGQGEAFLRSGRALGQVMAETGAIGAHYLGDIDAKGLAIPLDYNARQPDPALRVGAAGEFYDWLLAHGKRRACAPYPVTERVLQWLGAPERSRAIQILAASGYWMPQEALGTEALLSDKVLRSEA
ncbi:MAG: DUF2220 family protein [Burkholderiaceae bacterium]